MFCELYVTTPPDIDIIQKLLSRPLEHQQNSRAKHNPDSTMRWLRHSSIVDIDGTKPSVVAEIVQGTVHNDDLLCGLTSNVKLRYSFGKVTSHEDVAQLALGDGEEVAGF
jgi:hypothetical protein